jgi:hypothetical protein
MRVIPLNPIDIKQRLKGGDEWLLEKERRPFANVISVAHHNEEEAL